MKQTLSIIKKRWYMTDKECYQIRLQLDTYNELFSDFDPRPFHERELSDDFLQETKKASLDKGESIDILFLLPKEQRNKKDEMTIKKRLLTHFKRHNTLLQEEQNKLRRTGAIFVGIGIVLMVIATFFLYKFQTNLLASFTIILLEPASWFLFWEGLTLIIFTSKQKQPDRIFYEKMSQAHIFFENK